MRDSIEQDQSTLDAHIHQYIPGKLCKAKVRRLIGPMLVTATITNLISFVRATLAHPSLPYPSLLNSVNLCWHLLFFSLVRSRQGRRNTD